MKLMQMQSPPLVYTSSVSCICKQWLHWRMLVVLFGKRDSFPKYQAEETKAEVFLGCIWEAASRGLVAWSSLVTSADGCAARKWEGSKQFRGSHMRRGIQAGSQLCCKIDIFKTSVVQKLPSLVSWMLPLSLEMRPNGVKLPLLGPSIADSWVLGMKVILKMILSFLCTRFWILDFTGVGRKWGNCQWYNPLYFPVKQV